jgi:Protein of unknown function (DUF2905)
MTRTMGGAVAWPPRTDRRIPGPMPELGRVLIVLGIVLALVGLALVFADRVPWLGRLPGDVHVQRGNWTLYVPLGTSIVLSVILTLVLWLIGRR